MLFFKMCIFFFCYYFLYNGMLIIYVDFFKRRIVDVKFVGYLEFFVFFCEDVFEVFKDYLEVEVKEFFYIFR